MNMYVCCIRIDRDRTDIKKKKKKKRKTKEKGREINHMYRSFWPFLTVAFFFSMNRMTKAGGTSRVRITQPVVGRPM